MPAVKTLTGTAGQWNVTVKIYQSDGTTLATVYADSNGDATGANPLPKQRAQGNFGVDTSGNWTCWLTPGDYQVGVRPSGGSETKTPVTVAADVSDPVTVLGLVHGARADGDVPVWNESAGRLEWGSSGGSSAAGSPVVRAFPFAFDTAGLVAGHSVGYTPAVGDLLLDAWVEVTVAWDGTTPMFDFGSFDGVTYGIYGGFNAPVSLVDHDEEAVPPGYLKTDDGLYSLSLASVIFALGSTGDAAGLARLAPGKFTAADPIKVCVSTDGTTAGDDPAATQGAATLYLVTATPVAP